MRKIGRTSIRSMLRRITKKACRRLQKIDYGFVVLCIAWGFTGFALLCKWWRII